MNFQKLIKWYVTILIDYFFIIFLITVLLHLMYQLIATICFFYQLKKKLNYNFQVFPQAIPNKIHNFKLELKEYACNVVLFRWTLLIAIIIFVRINLALLF